MNFFSRYKKLFLALGFLILVGLIGYLLWQVFFRPAAPLVPVNPDAENINGLPQAGLGTSTNNQATGTGLLPGGVTPSGPPNPNEPSNLAVGGLTKTNSLVDSRSLNPTTAKDGGLQYYNQDDNRFYKIDKNGQVSLLSDKVFYNVENVVWANSRDKAILEYPDGHKIVYNFQTKEQVTLPSHWQNFSFSPDSQQIVAKSLGLDPENNWLIVSGDDGSKAKTIENIGSNDKTVYPAWSPNKQIIALYTQGVDFDRQEIFFVGLNGENFKSTLIEGRGLRSQWSTSGDRLLYSVYSSSNNMNPSLWVVDAAGDTINQNRRRINLNTWADKCTFASNTEVYCAVPENLPEGAGLFPELADKTKDNLYKVNLDNGTKELIAVPDGTFNISQIIAPSGDYLYFTDKKTGQIYQVRLK
ncbi:MAG: hypothetical protein WC863_00990 [Patescibacteria group bacterium]